MYNVYLYDVSRGLTLIFRKHIFLNNIRTMEVKHQWIAALYSDTRQQIIYHKHYSLLRWVCSSRLPSVTVCVTRGPSPVLKTGLSFRKVAVPTVDLTPVR